MTAKYKTIKVTKMYRGKADARCYIVEDCQRKGLGIEFTYGEEKRYVHPEEVANGEITTRGITPKFPLPNGMMTFSLVSWVWSKLARSKEERMEEIKQMDFFE